MQEIIVKVKETRVLTLRFMVDVDKNKVLQELREKTPKDYELVYQHPNLLKGSLDFYSYDPQPRKLGTHEATKIEVIERVYE